MECPNNICPKNGILSDKLSKKTGNSFPAIPTKFYPSIPDIPIPPMPIK